MSEVVYAAGRFDATAVYVPQTSPPPLVAQCPPFVPSNHSTVQPTYAMAEGMAVKITCLARARLVGNGSDAPVCLKDSTYSLARLKYSLGCAVHGRACACACGLDVSALALSPVLTGSRQQLSRM